MLKARVVILQITFTQKIAFIDEVSDEISRLTLSLQAYFHFGKGQKLLITGKTETFKYFCSFETIWMNLAAYYYKEINNCRSLLEIAFTLP